MIQAVNYLDPDLDPDLLRAVLDRLYDIDFDLVDRAFPLGMTAVKAGDADQVEYARDVMHGRAVAVATRA